MFLPYDMSCKAWRNGVSETLIQRHLSGRDWHCIVVQLDYQTMHVYVLYTYSGLRIYNCYMTFPDEKLSCVCWQGAARHGRVRPVLVKHQITLDLFSIYTILYSCQEFILLDILPD